MKHLFVGIVYFNTILGAEFPSSLCINFLPHFSSDQQCKQQLSTLINLGAFTWQNAKNKKKRKNLDQFRPKDFKKCFKKIRHDEILKQFQLYQYPAFRAFIRTFPETNNFVADLSRQLYFASWQKSGFCPIELALEERFPNASVDLIKKAISWFENNAACKIELAKKSKVNQLQHDYSAEQISAIKKNVIQESQQTELLCAQQCQLIQHAEKKEITVRCEQRYNALSLLQKNQHSWATRHYSVSSDATKLIRQENLEINHFNSCYGTQIQQILHEEFITITDSVAHKIFQQPVPPRNPFLMHIFEFAQTGLYYNHAGHIGTALDWAELSWRCLDLIEAAAEGIIQGIENTAHDLQEYVLHPIEAASGFLDNLITAATLLAKLTICHTKLNFTYHTNPLAFPEQLAHELEPIRQLAQLVADKITNSSARQIVKESSAFVTQAVLLHKGLGALNKFFTFAAQNATTCVNKIKQALVTADSAKVATISTIPLLIAQETAADLNTIAQTQVVIESANQEIAIVQKTLQTIEQIGHEKCQIIHALQTVLGPVYEELPILAKQFENYRKGFGEFSHKFVKLPLNHVLSMEFKLGKDSISLSGFHHDFMGAIEKSGLLKFVDKEYSLHGVYKAKVVLNGMPKSKTFFPADWSRQKVISKIYEAYDDFIVKGANAILKSDGKYLIYGYTNEGIKIEMYITKNACVTTAYPIFLG